MSSNVSHVLMNYIALNSKISYCIKITKRIKQGTENFQRTYVNKSMEFWLIRRVIAMVFVAYGNYKTGTNITRNYVYVLMALPIIWHKFIVKTEGSIFMRGLCTKKRCFPKKTEIFD